jgi:hypothetical protein
VIENAGFVTLYVDRKHNFDEPVTVHYYCIDQTAITDQEYRPVEGTLEFTN